MTLDRRNHENKEVVGVVHAWQRSVKSVTTIDLTKEGGPKYINAEKAAILHGCSKRTFNRIVMDGDIKPAIPSIRSCKGHSGNLYRVTDVLALGPYRKKRRNSR